MTYAVLIPLNSGMFLNFFDHTFIILIPKKNKLERVADFRLASLCNVVYKLMAKLLANRPKHVLPHVISRI